MVTSLAEFPLESTCGIALGMLHELGKNCPGRKNSPLRVPSKGTRGEPVGEGSVVMACL